MCCIMMDFTVKKEVSIQLYLKMKKDYKFWKLQNVANFFYQEEADQTDLRKKILEYRSEQLYLPKTEYLFHKK